ncbi:MAG: hypothetical protein R3E42_04620 [Burkholderiaceae bacterium]
MATAGQPRIMGMGLCASHSEGFGSDGSLWRNSMIELNEAFARPGRPCGNWACQMEDERVNAWGGAIALGHPPGASGAVGHHGSESPVRHRWALRARHHARGGAGYCRDSGTGLRRGHA